MTRLTEYYNLLEAHDWYYTYSDDGRVYQRGWKRELELETIAAESPAHQELFDAFRRHYFTGDDNTPYPDAPIEEVWV
jgi:hypothetical protein